MAFRQLKWLQVLPHLSQEKFIQQQSPDHFAPRRTDIGKCSHSFRLDTPAPQQKFLFLTMCSSSRDGTGYTIQAVTKIYTATQGRSYLKRNCCQGLWLLSALCRAWRKESLISYFWPANVHTWKLGHC